MPRVFQVRRIAKFLQIVHIISRSDRKLALETLETLYGGQFIINSVDKIKLSHPKSNYQSLLEYQSSVVGGRYLHFGGYLSSRRESTNHLSRGNKVSSLMT